MTHEDDHGKTQTRYVHLVQRRGQPGQPLVTLNLPPEARREVKVDFIDPPDATPPQVLTVKTLVKSKMSPVFFPYSPHPCPRSVSI